MMKQSLRIDNAAALTVGVVAGGVGFRVRSGSTSAGGDDRLKLDWLILPGSEVCANLLSGQPERGVHTTEVP